MATKQNAFKKLLMLLLLLNAFIPVFSKDIEYNPDTKSAQEIVEKATELSTSYTLKFKSGNDVPKYVKVTLTPKENQDTPTLCYSPTSTKCETDRRIFAGRVDKKPAIACMKRKEITEGSRNLNVYVSCIEKNCGYTLDFQGQDRCQLDANNGEVYSFIVKDDTTELEFEAFGYTFNDTKTFMNIGLEGSDTAEIHVEPREDEEDRFTLSNPGSKFVLWQLKDNPQEKPISLAQFKISGANRGEYLRLHVYTSHVNGEMGGLIGPDNLVYPGGPTVMGAVVETGVALDEMCLPVSAFNNDEFKSTTDFYLTGKIYTKHALFWLGDKDAGYEADSDIEYEDGLMAYVVHPGGTMRHICFEFSYLNYVEKREVVFSVQLIPLGTKTTPAFSYMTPPMITGQNYRHMLQKNKATYFSPTLLSSENQRFSFSLFNRKGIVEMYVAKCDNYPNCGFDMSKTENMELVRNTGKMSVYDREINKTIEAFDKEKIVMVVKCVDDGNDEEGYCEFDTSVNQKSKNITLVQGENFAKYAIPKEEGTFQIQFNKAFKLLSVGVEIMIHTGEVLFEGSAVGESGDSDFTVTKYNLANKVFINFDLKRELIETIYVNFHAIKYSFFTIKYVYNLASEIAPYSNEVIFAGESYMVSMDPNSAPLMIQFINDRYKAKNRYLTNFFSLNCEFKVKRNKTEGLTEIPFADGYAQDIIGEDQGKFYETEYYNYEVSIEKVEQSNYNKKMCMLYVIGNQLVDSHFSTRTIIGNNVNQQIIFNDDFRYIRFLYPIPDIKVDLIVYANVIDKGYYYINIAIDSEDNQIFREMISKSTPFYLDAKEYSKNCTANTFCNIIIEIDFYNEIPSLPKTNHMIEITVREPTQMKQESSYIRVPSYVQKGIAKKDFTTGDGYYYLYTDLGANDQGDITINFFRDYGEVYGRIVKKDVRDIDGEIEWMDMYRLPSHEWEGDGLKYNKYLKKYHIDAEDTQDCNGGCYLILGIIISQIGEWAEKWKFYTFSIITEINQQSYGESTDVPITTIQVDEFIIGNVDISKSVKISQFYQVWLPRDSSQISFDWQSELAGLYINIDDTLPTKANADFTLLPDGKDCVLTIERYQILDLAKKKGINLPYAFSIEDVKLTIGIWTDKTDTGDTELYSLRIHEANDMTFDLDIHEVNTDQKILCKPRDIGDGYYTCLFMVTFDDQDVEQNMNLLVYAASTNKGDQAEIYADFIKSSYYTGFDTDQLRVSIPGDMAKYNSIKDLTNYFYIKLGQEQKDKYFYVNVITHSDEDIMMVSSLNSYDEDTPNLQIFYPNARTEQIVQVKNDKESVILEFSSNSSLVVNIENLGGEADVRWEEDANIVHYLRGKGDRLTLTTSTDYKRLIVKKLKSDKPIEGADPGFVFLVDFYTRNPSKNFDEIVYGNSIEMAYRDTDLPLFLYCKAIDYKNDINVALTFRDSHIDTHGEYKSSPIIAKAFLDKRNTIYSAKLNPEFTPSERNKFDGIYDAAIKTAQMFLPDIDINQRIKIKPEDYPTLLVYIAKNPEYEEKKYQTFNVEAQLFRTNSLVIPVEKVYNYGKYNGMLPQYYRLRNDKKGIMKIVLSFNSDVLSYSIGDIGGRDNTYENTTLVGKGKTLITIKPGDNDFVFLNIFKTTYDDPFTAIQNYAFKYINVAKEEEFYDYEIYGKDPTIQYTEGKDGNKINSITVTFNRIDLDYDKANVTYFLKVADSRFYIPKENFTTVAVTETPYYAIYQRNPSANNNKITLSATGDFTNWCYIQVVAQIQANKVLEYVAYNGIYTEKNSPVVKPTEKPSDEEEESDSSDNTGLLIGISVTLAILIVGLAVVVFYFQRKNKSLINQVKHVSFQQVTGTSSDPDLLLQKN